MIKALILLLVRWARVHLSWCKCRRKSRRPILYLRKVVLKECLAVVRKQIAERGYEIPPAKELTPLVRMALQDVRGDHTGFGIRAAYAEP